MSPRFQPLKAYLILHHVVWIPLAHSWSSWDRCSPLVYPYWLPSVGLGHHRVAVFLATTKVDLFQQHVHDDWLGEETEETKTYASEATIEDCVDEPDNFNLSSISDADALLACRAYLQKRNLLGEWNEAQERKQRARQALRSMSSSSNELGDWNMKTKGFFWEDVSELSYLSESSTSGDLLTDGHNDRPEAKRATNEGSEEDDEILEPLWDTLVPARSTAQRFPLFDESSPFPLSISDDDGDCGNDETLEEDSDLRGAEKWSVFDDEPSISRIRRSAATKRMHANAAWKEQWYEQRWGAASSAIRSDPKQREQIKRERRIRRFSYDTFLAHEEMAGLSEEEIEHAILSYVQSNRKRSASRQQVIKERKEALQIGKIDLQGLPRDALLIPDPTRLQEQRNARSERAARAYRTRLAKQRRRDPSPASAGNRDTSHLDSPRVELESKLSPQKALNRIEHHLNAGKPPLLCDVETALIPPRLGRRKEILRRILSERFDLRGKCVIPLALLQQSNQQNRGDWESSEKLFVTQCSINELGAFVMFKLRQGLNASSD